MGCSGSKENHLRESISNGDIESVRTLVQNGHFKDSRDATGCTALHTASRVSQVEIVQLLLEAGSARQTAMIALLRRQVTRQKGGVSRVYREHRGSVPESKDSI